MTSELHDDRVARGGGSLGADAEPFEHGFDRLVERQATARTELRGHPDLGIDDAVGGQILSAFRRDARDRIRPLHDPERVGERLEVKLQALAVGATADPSRQVVDVGRWECVIAVLGCQIDDRGRSQTPVEVVVEHGLGRPDDSGKIRHGVMVRASRTLPRPAPSGGRVQA